VLFRSVKYVINFYGHTKTILNNGKEETVWEPSEQVVAEAYDNPIPGYNTFNSINLRLWKSLPSQEFNFEEFDKGDYFKAIEMKQRAELITSVLYPNDITISGKELRLKQQYFFVAASLQDIIRRFKKTKQPWTEFPAKIAIQLNDTHPSMAIVELLRVLIDVEKFN